MGAASTNQHSPEQAPGRRAGGNGLQRWFPFVVLLVVAIYGLLAAFLGQQASSLVGDTAIAEPDLPVMAWKSFVTGMLVFALLLNLSIVIRLRRPGLAWLSVLMVGVIYSQLVMDGLGLWLIWPGIPELNALLSVSLPLCLIALCEFTPHFIAVGRQGARLLRGFSLAAGLHLLAAPFPIGPLGQDVFLVVAATGGMFIFGLVLGQIRKHVYARYFALSVLAILVGALTTSLTTIGWLPVNPLTDSAFFLGAAAGSLILTSGVGRLLLEERKRRLSADIRAREEQALRAHRTGLRPGPENPPGNRQTQPPHAGRGADRHRQPANPLHAVHGAADPFQ